MKTARTHGGKVKSAWAKLGYVVKDGETGEICYTNQYCQRKAIYYTAEQVRQGTPEEIQEVFKPARDRKNKAARIQRAYKKGLARIKAAAAETIRNYKEEPYQKVIFDLETTGLDTRNDEILQISAINERGEILINAFVKPYKKEQWEDAERVNHISPDKVKDCKTLDYYAAEIQRILLSATELIAYNIDFDASFLECMGLEIPQRPYYDVMKEFAPIYGEYSEHLGGYKWQKLAKCADYYGYKFNPHDSLEDVKATLFCYQQMTKGQ